jgi:hypothetical protein
MKEFDNSQRQESRDWDASAMPAMKPPKFAVSVGGIHKFGQTSENTWKTESNLNIISDLGNDFNFPLTNGKARIIDAANGLELGTKSGSLNLLTSNSLYGTHGKEKEKFEVSPEIADTFEYKQSEDGQYTVSPTNAGPQEFAVAGPYTLRSEIKQAGPEAINRRITLHEAKGKSGNFDSEGSTSKSGTKGGINVGASGGAHQKTQINVEIDGNDMVVIAGGGKVKKMPKKEALANKELESALGGFDELLAKQKATGELGMQGAGDLASYFGYHYENTSEEKSVHTKTHNYETGGVIATDDQIVSIKQIPKPKPMTTARFEGEGQTEVSGDTEKQVSTFLQANQEIMTQVKNGFYRIKLSGYASSSGKEQRNQTLSVERAAAIEDLFIKLDPSLHPHKTFTSEGHGSEFARKGIIQDKDRSVVIEFVKVK